ncbi:MAG: hypothetical protein KAI06_05295 [Anaerolineales bacterium]|nr:hypothetical protein [Anaerolineales bacterium]
MNFDEYQEEELKQQYQRKGMGIGMALFMPFGVILWLLLDNPGFLGVGPALGVSVGIALGEAMYKRKFWESKGDLKS